MRIIIRYIIFVYIYTHFIFLLSCFSEQVVDDPEVLLSRLFIEDNLTSVNIHHSDISPGGFGYGGHVSIQASIPADIFRDLLSNCLYEEIIVAGEGIESNLYHMQFVRELRNHLPDYSTQQDGLNIWELKRAYKIMSTLDIPVHKDYVNVPRIVESYVIVDDRTTDTYTVFLAVNPYLSNFKVLRSGKTAINDTH